MAKRGRKPANDTLKILRGGDAGPATTPAPAPGRPECPGYLDDDARAEWHRLADELAGMGVLTPEARALLTLYCNAFSRWLRARRETLDVTCETAVGGAKPNPAVAVEQAAEATMLKILAEMGLTPASRNRVAARTEGPKDRLGEFLARRKAK